MWFWIVLLLLCETKGSQLPQPKITSQDGHLTFMAADHKNISFQTQGNGRVHVNGIDLTQAAETTQNAINAMAKYETNFDSVFEKMSRFEQLYHSLSHVIPQQRDADNSSYISRRKLRNLNKRVTSLSVRVRRIQVLLVTDECVSNPCKNGGTCQDQYNSFYCHCPPEWEGPLCDKDVNECGRFAGTDLGCQNGATCINRKGSYDCLCPHGYFGLHCIRRSADCSTGSGELCGHGTCVPQNNDVGYKCLCDEGWTTDGNTPACRIDVNECNMSRPPCSINPLVECVNTPGSFVCAHCPAGYSGNGYYCTDIDECQSSNGGCSVNPMVQCINTLGSRLCGACPPGYVGDGVTCNYQGGACSVNNGGCHPLATCRDNNRISSSYVQCTCPLGFVGNGLGYNGCTRSLVTIDACSSNPCVHGSCVANSSSDYICLCLYRYSGRNCEVFRDLCSSNPCLNGGTCTTVMGLRLRCICANGFMGVRCEQQKQACGGQFTEENGTIAYPSGTFTTYNHRVSCVWTIETNLSKVLNITFTKFDLEAGSRCQFDWLQIHDGMNTAATSIGRFCGKALPNGGNIVSTHNSIYLWFRSDSTVVSSGFELSWTSVNPVCGEQSFVSSHGTIQSPGSPGNYPNNRYYMKPSRTFIEFIGRAECSADCYWLLMATSGKRLLFHFFTLMIGNDSDCNHDYLEFISGAETNDPIFAKYCNTTRPAPLFSVGSEVLVHFHSDSSITYPGFQVTYSEVEGIPGCGGVFTQDHGQIRSPSYNGHYPPDMLCEYKIQLPAKSRIKLTFLSFSVEDSDECKFDSVSIHAGSNVDAPLIGRYCGNTIPPSYVSDDNNLLIVFKTDWATGREGFVLEYELLCGGQFRESSGIIESPGYPKLYPSSTNCGYEIIQPLGTAIELRILVLDIEANYYPNCSYAYLEVRDGDNENSTLIGRYCRKPPPLILSSFNILYLRFSIYTNFAMGKGFQANYTTIKTGCGGILKESGGTITPPNHPTLYQSNLHCLWMISAPPGNVVQLIWLNFGLESSHNCAYDYVEIFDNNTETGRGGSMGRFCGQKKPPIVISTSNIISVVFHTDSSITSEGFLATYSFVDERTACGGNYYTSTGYIRTPNYPETYPLNIECSWTINVEPGHQIMLNVTDFELESSSNCRYDYLEIRNGATTASPLLGKYCGKDIPKLIPSHTNKLHLYLKSDLTKSSKGFKIFWDGTSTGCGGSLTAPSGSITSPHYPEPYNSNAECLWKISVSAGSLIQLIFADLELEVAMNCTLDYVQIFDGPTISSNSLGRFCVNSAPPLKSSSNHVVVKFRSDISQSGRGFQLQYSTACNNTLRGFGGVIESPNFPSPYLGNLNCNWDIEVARQNKINITFSHFQLEFERPNFFYNDTENMCAYDFVEVQYKNGEETVDSESRSFEKFATYCGDEKPPPIHINSDVAQVRFVTDNLVNGNGFRLEWVIDGCGGILTHPEGSIQSPNYPRAYPPSIECNWKIQVEFGNSIEITFGIVNIEKDSFCHYDSITIYNGEDETFLPIAKFCRQDKPVTVTSTGNFMYVKFEADSSYQGTGFYANYSTQATKCGGKYVHDKGSIMSPNYPLNNDINGTCGYEIEVKDGHLVALQFSDVDLLLPRNVSCSLNNVSYIKVYDGPTAAYPVLTKICGKDTPNTTFISTNNYMYVEIVNNGNWAWKGFLANYHKACGARIETNSTGFIKRDPHDTDDNDNCTWTIVASDPTKHVSLTISQFSSFYTFCEDSTSLAPLIVYNGGTADAPILGQYCESKLPPMLTTDGSTMHIVSTSSMLLFATYSVYDSACGGTLLGNDGYFSSPGYPKKYPMNSECEWNIKIPEGNSAALTFSYFQLLKPDNSCNTDYLEIRRNSSNGKLLGVFCGDNVPTNITNEGSLWIFLKTSSVEGDLSDITAKGFYGEYTLMHQNEFFGPSGVIVSPITLDQYSDYGDYSWKITVDFGKRVLITFKEMSIDHISEGLCSSSIHIYDGPDGTGQNLGSFCGTNLPDPVKTTSNVAFILANFYMSTRNENQFKLEWLQVDSSLVNDRLRLPTKSPSPHSYDPIDMSASKNATYITSPGYPNGYGNDLDHAWVFTTISMNHLELWFTDLDLESNIHSPLCYLDYVELFKKTDTSKDWESINKFCHYNETYKLIVGTNLMKVVFKTNRYLNGTGFKAQIFEDCGGSLTDPSGFIIFDKTPKANQPLRFLKTCQWNVTVRSGKTIKVEIIKLKITTEQNGACKSYLMLRNGQFPDSPLLGNGKYCGDQKSIILQTTGNHLYVKYSGAVATGEFTIKYQEQSYDCGGDIALSQFENSAELSSPHYPNVPQSHIECTWIILAPAAETIRIDFVDRFDLTSSKDCTKEYVEIRDGGTVLSPSLGTFCRSAPNSLFTSDNFMFVKFFTDVDDPGNGFKAKVSIEKCGGTLRDHTGVLTSPFFNQLDKYPIDFNCTWHLKVADDYENMKIKFNKIDLPDAENCTGVDFVEISEVDKEGILPETSKTSLSTTPVSYKFCGKSLPTPFTTSGNEAVVHFQSGKKKHLAGFSLTFESNTESCGGALEVSNAIFTSPGYPRPQQGYRSCPWMIKVPAGRRVRLEFIDIDIDDFDGSSFRTGLSIYQKGYQGVIGTIRSNNAPKVYYSSGNTMLVQFWSHSNNRRGFKAAVSSNEPTLCQANLENLEGSMSQPIPLQSSYYCSYELPWLLFENLSTAFSVTFATNNSELGKYSNCRYSSVGSVRIRRAGSGDNKDLYSICTPKKNVILRSPYLAHEIITLQHHFLATINYTISYKVYFCGGIISSESGVITSPDYPKKSSKSFECCWLLKLPEEQSISLTFIGLNLSSDCEKNFIDIYNGPTPDSPMLGKYCHNNMPSASITSQTNSLWIEYSFDKDSDGIGFSLKYDPVIHGCGGVFHDRSRVIQTPTYPKEYPNNAECLWELQSERGYSIGLHFNARFQLEQSDNCQNDFLEIWDWQDEEWVSLGRKCGREIPQFVNSTSNKMKILFRSNDKITGAGFRAQWEWNCGGTFAAHEKIGYIASPGYPGEYKPNMNCQYNITSSRSEYIVINFLEFELEDRHPTCKYDNVTVNGFLHTHYYAPKNVYCGNVSPPDVRLPGKVVVTFRTDSMTQASGFLFSYQIDECGGNVNAPGVIKSPSLNNKRSSTYLGYTVCVWNITAPPNKQVVLQFEHFNLTMRRGCYFHNVEIYEGLNARAANLLANLCGDLDANPPHLRSTGNSLSVRLKTDRTSNVGGFEATIFFADGPESGCGGTLNITTETELSSPNLNDMDCTWTVYTPPDTSVKIHFVGINLPGSCGSKNHTLTGCKCGSLEIKDGASSLSDNIEKLCGVNSVPRDIVTSTRTSYIRLVTRGVNRDALRIHLTPLPSACGPYLLNVTNAIQTLQSPNYPNTYPPNLGCTWRLKGSGKFVVHFEDFDLLEKDDDLLSVPACNWDKFEIVDDAERLIIDQGLGNRVVLMGQRRNYTDFNNYNTINGIHQFCGRSNKPFDYYTQKEQIAIKFSSGEFGQTRGRGFKLQYHLASGCSRNYSSISGRVVSTGTKNCYSTISVAENRTISVFFLHFVSFAIRANCADMGIEIRDGKDSSGKLLLKACGFNLPSPIFSSTNNLWLHSWSNNTYTGSYDFTYTSTDQGKGCGGPLYNYRGRFSSPLYPLTYKSDQECRWSVRVPVGMRVAINFLNFDIQGTCGSNFVKVTTYSATAGKTFHTVFCKDDNPAPIYSETSGLEVTYHSSHQNEGTGWLIAFEAVNK